MRTRFDLLAKLMLAGTLAPLGDGETEAEVPATEARRFDYRFEPTPGRVPSFELGLVGRLAAEPCVFESFYRTPTHDQVLDCLQKQLTFWRGRRDEAHRAPPRLWILSSGFPQRAVEELRLAPEAGWPEGVYTSAGNLRYGIVVISHLPRERGTLPLRLIGRGRVQKEAIEELKQLPLDAMERRIIEPVLVRLHFMVAQMPGKRTKTESEYLLNVSELAEEYLSRNLRDAEMAGERKGLEKGLEKGRQEGRVEELRRMLSSTYRVRFGAVPARLQQRLNEIGDPRKLEDLNEAFVTGTKDAVMRAVEGLRSED